MDIVFHIGLGKCGSSTLQNKVFRSLPGFMGAAEGIPWRDNFAKQFQIFSPVAGRQTGNLRLAAKWVDSVRQEASSRQLSGQPIIISNETLSAANRIRWRPIIKFLSSFTQKYWTEGQVRILVIFRAQPSRLGSLYAQSSRCNPSASQSDFEEFVSSFLKRKQPVFDYALWYRDLVASFGEDNICMLPLEGIESDFFWDRMGSLLCLDQHVLRQLREASSDRANARSMGDGFSWGISEFDPEHCAEITVRKWLNLLWPGGIAPQVKKSTSARLAKHLKRVWTRRIKRSNSQPERGEFFELTSEIEDAVLSVYRASNENLSQFLGIDLEPYGY